jgi:hypothetical protein
VVLDACVYECSRFFLEWNEQKHQLTVLRNQQTAQNQAKSLKGLQNPSADNPKLSRTGYA